MTYATSKYKKEQTDEWTGRIAVILAGSENELTIEDIQNRDMCLAGVSMQKMARMISHLVEMGMVVRAKRRDGKMVYKSLAVMEEQGYDVSLYKND